AIRLFNTKTRALPTRVDDLVQQRFLRKKYKDPITNDDFELISAANPNPGGVQGSSLPGGRGAPQRISSGPPATTGRLGANSNPNSGFNDTVPGGIQGVRSKSKDESIRLFLGRNHYNEWMFFFQGLGAGGGRGGQPINPGQRGGGPGQRSGAGPGGTGFPGGGTGFPGGGTGFPGGGTGFPGGGVGGGPGGGTRPPGSPGGPRPGGPGAPVPRCPPGAPGCR